ncbi:kinesin [Chloropicon primus]|uniref:Kinesin-like protein n=1 Tax=Chloropicon primus TaxID=1764295 RepID=A0A5B8MNA4_9CHLO|nr:kinesin [Chloropicon primus]UPR01276.1 kinesin [Chloropicon primus]|eukprot:QDZ22056.1 kinesin [Chloropicon primus]
MAEQTTERKMEGTITDKPKGSVRVCIRVRPQLKREVLYRQVVEAVSDKIVHLLRDGSIVEAQFDRVFDQDVSQKEAYESVSDAVEAVTKGYNSTIFAYGQTGTGKTFTILGGSFTGKESVAAARDESSATKSAGRNELPQYAGIIPRAADELFHFAQQSALKAEKVDVFCTYLEIYNERMHDLLEPFKKSRKKDPLDVSRKKAGLELRDDPERGIYVPGSTVVKVTSAQSLMKILRRGNKHRTVRQTEMNQKSSRSHTILQLSVEQKVNRGGKAVLIRSKLNLVDLAGSERFPQMESEEERIQEQRTINASLSALANCIACITEKGRVHIPYRDSKLTHLLQDSLGGNCLTTIVATISPSECAVDETMSTLKFATRASNVKNVATTNIVEDPRRQIEAKDKEIERLRMLLSKFISDDGNTDISVLTSLQEKLNDATVELDSLRVEAAHLREELKSEKLQKKQLLGILKAKQDERYEYRADGSLSRQGSSGRASRTPQDETRLGPDGTAGHHGYANSDSGMAVKQPRTYEEGMTPSTNMLKFQDRMRSEIDYQNSMDRKKKSTGAAKKKTGRSTLTSNLPEKTPGNDWSKMQQEIDSLRSNLGMGNGGTLDFESQPVNSPKKAWGRSSLFRTSSEPQPPPLMPTTNQMAWTNSNSVDDQFKLNKSTSNRSVLEPRTNFGRSTLGLGQSKAKPPTISRAIDETQFDRGSLIYILGNSSSSVWAKKIMSDIEKGNRRLKNIQGNRTRGGFA